MSPYEQGFRDAIAAAAKTAKTSNFVDGPSGTIEGQIAEAISALSPEDDPGDPAFYRSAQTGVEPALPPTRCSKHKDGKHQFTPYTCICGTCLGEMLGYALTPTPEYPQHPPGQGAGKATVGASGQPGAVFSAAPEGAECATCGRPASGLLRSGAPWGPPCPDCAGCDSEAAETCATCGGNGFALASADYRCRACGGTGRDPKGA